MSANTNSKLTKDNHFIKAILMMSAFCAAVIATILTIMIYPGEKLPIFVKFAIFFGLTFVLILSLINIQQTINARSRKILTTEISKLRK